MDKTPAARSAPISLRRCLTSARDELVDLLTAFEAMWPDCGDIVTSSGLGYRSPLSGTHGICALIEVQGHDAEHVAFMRWLEDGFEGGLFPDALVAASGRDLGDFGALREVVAELSKITGKCLSFDIGTSPSLGEPFVEACRHGRAWRRHAEEGVAAQRPISVETTDAQAQAGPRPGRDSQSRQGLAGHRHLRRNPVGRDAGMWIGSPLRR